MIEITYFQSNIREELIDKIQELGFTYDDYYAWFIHIPRLLLDAIKAITTPVIVVHFEHLFA
jgi:3-dehydroquinate dehydratase